MMADDGARPGTPTKGSIHPSATNHCLLLPLCFVFVFFFQMTMVMIIRSVNCPGLFLTRQAPSAPP
jgi:hypothetical protein